MKRQPGSIMVSVLACLPCVGIGVVEVTGQGQDEPPNPPRVTLTVDYGDGVQKVFTSLPWSPSMTVGTALESARRHPRGIRFQQRGRGSTAFLTQIDDLKNEGGSGRNWIYRINGDSGDRSFAVRELRAGDRVLWKFESFRFR
jgi:hypothetical protein